jgi:hypothetical protein
MPQPEWNLKLAGHLLRRATFGFTASQLQQALADGPRKTIDRLLTPPPDYPDFEQTIASLTPREPSQQETAQLKLYRMMHSPYPLHEKATLLLGTPERDLVFSPPAYRKIVKSPIEYALNLAIALDIELVPAQLQTQLAALGQPLVGWALVRPRWLNPYTIIARSNLAASILAKAKSFPAPQTLIETLLQNDAPPAVLAKLNQLEGRDLAQAIGNQPEYQLL